LVAPALQNACGGIKMTDIIGLIKKHLNTRFRELQTVEVVIVESVDYTTWKCSVRPKARIDVRGDVQDMPIIMNVPIAVQKAGDSVLLMPVKVNDICLCVFSKHALDNLLIDKQTNTVTIPRSFDINDCLLIAGVYTEMETVPQISESELLIHHQSGAHIHIDSSGNIEIKGKRIDFTEL
jgi:hypothetical protein